jgi:hypothetical protein
MIFKNAMTNNVTKTEGISEDAWSQHWACKLRKSQKILRTNIWHANQENLRRSCRPTLGTQTEKIQPNYNGAILFFVGPFMFHKMSNKERETIITPF